MKKILFMMCLILTSLVGFSQTNVVEFLKGGKADANKLFQAYLQPYAFALGDGLNNGWYSTADTHHLLGFDLTLGVSAIQIPDGSRTFDINKLGLTNMKVETGSSIAPTVSGEKSQGPRVTVYDNQKKPMVEFNSPQGTGLNIVPVPMVQVGFGLLPHTDIMVRYVPELKYNNNGDNMKIGLWGIGGKHNFLKSIPVLKQLPIDASVFASYSEVNGQSDVNFTSANYSSNPNISIEPVNTAGQSLELKTKTSKYGLVVSKKVAILTVFGAIGKSTSKSNVNLLGTYPVVATTSAGGYEITQAGALKDPVALDFQTSNVSMEAGLRIKLAVLSLFGSVNKSQYTSYTVGISLGM